MALPKIELLEQEMDRKDFLKSVGVGLALVLGGGMIMNAVAGINKQSTAAQSQDVKRSSYGYGMSGYGR